MQCARIHLRERPKTTAKICRAGMPDQPRRFCQKRMVNPAHEEDPRWIVFEKLRTNAEEYQTISDTNYCEAHENTENNEDLYLSVQTLKFLGEEQQRKRARPNFKYKTPTGDKHRMFVKQPVEFKEDDDTSSLLSCYYFDDYVKYILHSDKSRPSSSQSSFFLQGISSSKENREREFQRESKSTQVPQLRKKTRFVETKTEKTSLKIDVMRDLRELVKDEELNDTKVTFHNAGKRKCLTISRVPSPETVQVIRVDVVCNSNSGSIISDYENKKYPGSENLEDKKPDIESPTETKIGNLKMNPVELNNNRYGKYLLTNTVKSLDESVGAGKVTLLCKTFRLNERNRGRQPVKK